MYVNSRIEVSFYHHNIFVFIFQTDPVKRGLFFDLMLPSSVPYALQF